MGIDDVWTKVVLHQLKEGATGHFNLPRVLWIRKDWTLKQLHWHMFDYFKDLFLRWFRDISEKGSSARSQREPQYTYKDKKLDLKGLEELFAANDV